MIDGRKGLFERGLPLPRTNRTASIVRRIVLAALVTIGLPFASARAASFDCGAASTMRERAICSDARLSRADDALNRTYRADLAKLSPVGAASIRDDERAFLKQTDPICRPADDNPTRDRAAYYRRCLLERYRARTLELLRAVRVRGPYVFYTVARDVVAPAPGPSYGTEGVYSRVEYPQIDRPDAAAQKWNERVAAKQSGDPRCLLEPETATVVVHIPFVAPGVIATSGVRFTDPCERWAAPDADKMIDLSTITALDPKPHRATGADLFRPGSGWEALLRRLTLERFRKLAFDDVCDFPIQTHLPDPTRPDRWSFSDWGFEVSFYPDDIDPECGRRGGSGFVVRWKDLAPYLKAGVSSFTRDSDFHPPRPASDHRSAAERP